MSFAPTYEDNPSEDQKEEFLNEIQQMKLLGAHQNIVSLVGCCTLQERKFLVIEYVPFGDLLQWLRRRRRSVRRFLKTSFILSQLFHSNEVLRNRMKGKRVNLSYRPYSWANPSQVILRFIRSCSQSCALILVTWSAQAFLHALSSSMKTSTQRT